MARIQPQPAHSAARDPVSLDDLVSPAELARKYPDKFTEAGLRWAIRQRRHNGLGDHDAVLIVRKRAMLVRPRFERWLADQVA
jgi:flavin-dependent dehydrogenase